MATIVTYTDPAGDLAELIFSDGYQPEETRARIEDPTQEVAR